MTNGDEIEDPHRAVFSDRLASQDLAESQPVIYDQPIGLRLLYQDPRSGAEHYLVRYPAGLRAQRHRHSAAHTIIVIEGALLAEGQVLAAGAYVHFPAGTPMSHEPAPGHGCLFVIIFDGPFDVHPVADEDHGGAHSPELRV